MQIRTFTECSCDKCKSMCKNSPCLGTPADIQKIIDAGHKDRLKFSIWHDEKTGNTPLPMIAPIKGAKGCVFQNADDLCNLHEAGLKPTEGKIAMHDVPDNGLRRTIAWSWVSEAGIAVFEQFGVEDISKLKELIREMIPFVKQGRMSQIG
jgi:hypothetical protein